METNRDSEPLDIPNDIAVKDDVLDVVPVSDDKNAVIKNKIRDSIARSDPALALMWDRLSEMADPNEMLKLNLAEMQVVFRTAQDEFWERRKELTEMLKRGPKYRASHESEIKILHADINKDRKHLTELVKTIKQLSQEYRQCLMQQKYNVHISVIAMWKMAMENAVYSNVSDEHQRRAIASAMREAGRALCPVVDKEL